MFKINFVIISIIFVVFVSAFILLSPDIVNAGASSLLWGNQETNVSNTIGLGEKDPRIIAASVINIALGFIGIITMLIIFFGVFKVATSGGNDDKVAEGKNFVIAGVIGLIIVLASWGLAKFVVDLIYNATQ